MSTNFKLRFDLYRLRVRAPARSQPPNVHAVYPVCTHWTSTENRNKHTHTPQKLHYTLEFTIIDIVVSLSRCRRTFALFCALNLHGRDRLLSMHNICINKFISHACHGLPRSFATKCSRIISNVPTMLMCRSVRACVLLSCPFLW